MKPAARRAAVEVLLRSTRLSGSTRAARAKAAIISPFHAVRTLSSRCGRGRRARAANRPLADAAERRPYLLPDAMPQPGGDVLEALGHVQQVLARELALRILRRVARRFDPETPPRNFCIVRRAASAISASLQM